MDENIKTRTIIYLRTSTKEQNPDNQLSECIGFANARGLVVDIENDIFIEKESAWKNENTRIKYNEIKRLSHEGKINAVIVWSLDRWVRDRDCLIEDISYLTTRNVRIYSVKEPFLESINIEGPLGKTIKEFLFGLVGSLGEMESNRRSERVKIAYENFKGDHWGRKRLSIQARNKVVSLHKEGYSYREIASLVQISDKNNNLKNISKSVVHKIINEIKRSTNLSNSQF